MRKFKFIFYIKNILTKRRKDLWGEEKEILLTQEGYDKLEQELDTLKTEKRAEISERIKNSFRIWRFI